MTKEEVIRAAIAFLTNQDKKPALETNIASLEFAFKDSGSLERAPFDMWRVRYVDSDSSLDPGYRLIVINDKTGKAEFEMIY